LVSEACEVVSRGKCGCCKESEAQFETMKALVEAAAGCLALECIYFPSENGFLLRFRTQNTHGRAIRRGPR
jgi:hypothetical protein